MCVCVRARVCITACLRAIMVQIAVLANHVRVHMCIYVYVRVRLLVRVRV